jgi:hypothetical protein
MRQYRTQIFFSFSQSVGFLYTLSLDPEAFVGDTFSRCRAGLFHVNRLLQARPIDSSNPYVAALFIDFPVGKGRHSNAHDLSRNGSMAAPACSGIADCEKKGDMIRLGRGVRERR